MSIQIRIALIFVPFLVQCKEMPPGAPQGHEAMPMPREISQKERETLAQLVKERFQQDVPSNAQYQAAGVFRSVVSQEFHYMDRTDIGSVTFDMSRYGISQKQLDPESIDKNALLPRLEETFRNTKLQANGRQFRTFQDEFTNNVTPLNIPKDFDPRSGKHVARTAQFQRHLDNIPVFSSELLIGQMENGKIGRFRLHWPEIHPEVIQGARKLVNMINQKEWTVPESFRDQDIQILEVTPGIAHSSMADPRYEAQAVVRVLYRKEVKGTPHPLSSIAYKYFDLTGNEIIFNSFPKHPGTRSDAKMLKPKTE
jgi:hypothetical protein